VINDPIDANKTGVNTESFMAGNKINFNEEDAKDEDPEMNIGMLDDRENI
jgi:hypothetical protein